MTKQNFGSTDKESKASPKVGDLEMKDSMTVALLIENIGKNSKGGRSIIGAIVRAGMNSKNSEVLMQIYPYIDPAATIKALRNGKRRVLRDQVAKIIFQACRDKGDEQALCWIIDNVNPKIRTRSDSDFTIAEQAEADLEHLRKIKQRRSKPLAASYPA